MEGRALLVLRNGRKDRKTVRIVIPVSFFPLSFPAPVFLSSFPAPTGNLMEGCRYCRPPGALLLHDGFQLARVGGKVLDGELVVLRARSGPGTSSNKLRHP